MAFLGDPNPILLDYPDGATEKLVDKLTNKLTGRQQPFRKQTGAHHRS